MVADSPDDIKKKWLEKQKAMASTLDLASLAKRSKAKPPPAAAFGSAPLDDEKRTEYREIMEQWSEDGYSTSALASVLEDAHDLDAVSSKFSEYRNNLDALQTLHAVFDALDTTGVEDEAETVDDALFDPMDLDGARAAIERLKAAIEDEKKKSSLRDLVLDWAEEGFEVAPILAAIDSSSYASAKRELKNWERSVERLRELQQRLEALRSEPVLATLEMDVDIDTVAAQLTDPAAVVEAEDALFAFEEEIDAAKRAHAKEQEAQKERAAKKRLTETVAGIRQQYDEWLENGFQLGASREFYDHFLDKYHALCSEEMPYTKIEEITAYDLKKLEEEMSSTEAKIARAMELGTRLVGLTKDWNVETIESIRKQLHDLDSLPRLEERVEEIASNMEREATIRGRLQTMISTWKGEGYNVGALEDAMAEDIDTIFKKLEEFKRKLGALEELEEELDALDTTHFPSKARAIQEKLHDPDAIPAIKQELLALRIGNEADEAREAGASANGAASPGAETGDVEVVFDEEHGGAATGTVAASEQAPVTGGAAAAQPTEEQEEERPLDVPKALKHARRLYSKKQYHDAIALYRRILAKDSENRQAKFYFKKSQLKLKRAGKKPPQPKPSTRSKKPKGDPDCPACHGSGICSSCKGKAVCYWCKGSGKCDRCDGTGAVHGEKCMSCNGTGECTWCKGAGQCYWCHGTGLCDRCIDIASQQDTGSAPAARSPARAAASGSRPQTLFAEDPAIELDVDVDVDEDKVGDKDGDKGAEVKGDEVDDDEDLWEFDDEPSAAVAPEEVVSGPSERSAPERARNERSKKKAPSHRTMNCPKCRGPVKVPADLSSYPYRMTCSGCGFRGLLRSMPKRGKRNMRRS